MDFTLSQHAIDAIRERTIQLEWIAATLGAPSLVTPDKEDPDIKHAMRVIPEHGNRVLRVIYNRTREPIHVVTVFFDRAMKGKL